MNKLYVLTALFIIQGLAFSLACGWMIGLPSNLYTSSGTLAINTGQIYSPIPKDKHISWSPVCKFIFWKTPNHCSAPVSVTTDPSLESTNWEPDYWSTNITLCHHSDWRFSLSVSVIMVPKYFGTSTIGVKPKQP